MPTETELKLRITPAHLAKLRRHRLFRTHQLSKPSTRHLHNIYFDTPKLDLHRNEMALRLRSVSGHWLQTLKGGGSVKGGLHQRNEWEAAVPSAELDFTILDAAIWDEHLPQRLRKKLKPVFVTDFSRTSRMVEYQGAEIEVCMDQGEVKTSEHSAPICEVELELKSGDPQQLFQLALAILEIVPFELESVSKAERGFRLMAGFIEQPVKAEPLKLAKKDRLSEVLQTLIWSCLLHLQKNIHGMVAGNDAEYLHQMRVASRRLRVALRMAEKVNVDATLSALRGELAAWADALGKIRDWDVFIAGQEQRLTQRVPEHGGLQALLEHCEAQRADCYAALRSVAQQRELQGMMLRFAIWMNSAYWQQMEEGSPRADDFATRQLQRLNKRYRQAALHLETLDATGLHDLRIITKKLRYSTEFFVSLYELKPKNAFMHALGEVQEVLGNLNDASVANRLLDEMAGNPGLSAHLQAIGYTRGWIAHQLSGQLSVLSKALRHFSGQEAFWDK